MKAYKCILLDEHINQKGFAFTPTTKKMPLLLKKCKTVFCKTLIANAGINYTKKKNRNKIYNKNHCQKYTTIRIPKYNNIFKKTVEEID